MCFTQFTIFLRHIFTGVTNFTFQFHFQFSSNNENRKNHPQCPFALAPRDTKITKQEQKKIHSHPTENWKFMTWWNFFSLSTRHPHPSDPAIENGSSSRRCRQLAIMGSGAALDCTKQRFRHSSRADGVARNRRRWQRRLIFWGVQGVLKHTFSRFVQLHLDWPYIVVIVYNGTQNICLITAS